MWLFRSSKKAEDPKSSTKRGSVAETKVESKPQPTPVAVPVSNEKTTKPKLNAMQQRMEDLKKKNEKKPDPKKEDSMPKVVPKTEELKVFDIILKLKLADETCDVKVLKTFSFDDLKRSVLENFSKGHLDINTLKASYLDEGDDIAVENNSDLAEAFKDIPKGESFSLKLECGQRKRGSSVVAAPVVERKPMSARMKVLFRRVKKAMLRKAAEFKEFQKSEIDHVLSTNTPLNIDCVSEILHRLKKVGTGDEKCLVWFRQFVLDEGPIRMTKLLKEINMGKKSLETVFVEVTIIRCFQQILCSKEGLLALAVDEPSLSQLLKTAFTTQNSQAAAQIFQMLGALMMLSPIGHFIIMKDLKLLAKNNTAYEKIIAKRKNSVLISPRGSGAGRKESNLLSLIESHSPRQKDGTFNFEVSSEHVEKTEHKNSHKRTNSTGVAVGGRMGSNHGIKNFINILNDDTVLLSEIFSIFCFLNALISNIDVNHERQMLRIKLNIFGMHDILETLRKKASNPEEKEGENVLKQISVYENSLKDDKLDEEERNLANPNFKLSVELLERVTLSNHEHLDEARKQVNIVVNYVTESSRNSLNSGNLKLEVKKLRSASITVREAASVLEGNLPIIAPLAPPSKISSLIPIEEETTSGVKVPVVDEKFAKYTKMKGMNMPEGAIRQKMAADKMDPKDIEAFLSGTPLPAPSKVESTHAKVETTSTTAPAVDEKFAKFEKMKGMNLPDGAIRQKMLGDKMDPKDIEAFFSGAYKNSSSSAPAPVVNEKFAKYELMKKNGLPEGAIRNKMKTDGMSASETEEYFSGKTASPAKVEATTETSKPTTTAVPSVDKYAVYKKMKDMKLPDTAIRTKMIGDGLPAEEADAYLSGKAYTPGAGAPKEASKPLVKQPAGPKMKAIGWTKVNKTDLVETSMWNKDDINVNIVSAEDDLLLKEYFLDLKGKATTSSEEKGEEEKAKEAKEIKVVPRSFITGDRTKSYIICSRNLKDKNPKDIVKALEDLSVASLTPDLLSAVEKCIPDEKESSMINDYLNSKGPNDPPLAPAEQFMSNFFNLKRGKEKIRVIHTQRDFVTRLAVPAGVIARVLTACQDTYNNEGLPIFLKCTLVFGNQINTGTFRQNSVAVRISEIADVLKVAVNPNPNKAPANDGPAPFRPQTAFHFLADKISKLQPKATFASINSSMTNVHMASALALQIDGIQSMLKELIGEFKAVKDEVNHCTKENIGDVTEAKNFVETNAKLIEKVEKDWAMMLKECQKLCEHFHEFYLDDKPLKLFTSLSQLMKTYDNITNDNAKQIALNEKNWRQAKEADDKKKALEAKKLAGVSEPTGSGYEHALSNMKNGIFFSNKNRREVLQDESGSDDGEWN